MKLGVAARDKAEVKDICSFTRIYIYICFFTLNG